jgi:hypothetical protein
MEDTPDYHRVKTKRPKIMQKKQIGQKCAIGDDGDMANGIVAMSHEVILMYQLFVGEGGGGAG